MNPRGTNEDPSRASVPVGAPPRAMSQTPGVITGESTPASELEEKPAPALEVPSWAQQFGAVTTHQIKKALPAKNPDPEPSAPQEPARPASPEVLDSSAPFVAQQAQETTPAPAPVISQPGPPQAEPEAPNPFSAPATAEAQPQLPTYEAALAPCAEDSNNPFSAAAQSGEPQAQDFSPAPPVSAPEPTAAEEVPEVPAPTYPPAWQPFTFAGIARFANASLGRLLLVQLVVAMTVAATVVWSIDQNYSPVIVEATQKMPDQALILHGTLRGVSSQMLSENHFFSIGVNLNQTDDLGQSADLQLELHKYGLEICSTFRSISGVVTLDYPPVGSYAMGRQALDPWWGAWHPIYYAATALLVVAGLMLTWAVLATLYALIPRLIAYYADRSLTLGQSWKVAGAALMPGALVMEIAIVLYSLQVVNLISLVMYAATHILVEWIYVIGSPWSAPKNEALITTSNPFGN